MQIFSCKVIKVEFKFINVMLCVFRFFFYGLNILNKTLKYIYLALENVHPTKRFFCLTRSLKHEADELARNGLKSKDLQVAGT